MLGVSQRTSAACSPAHCWLTLVSGLVCKPGWSWSPVLLAGKSQMGILGFLWHAVAAPGPPPLSHCAYFCTVPRPPCRRGSARPALGQSSRRLLGTSFATLSHKWEPRFAASGGHQAADQAAEAEPWAATGGASGWSDLEAPLLPSPVSAASPLTPRDGRRWPSSGSGTGGSGEGSEGGGASGGSGVLSRRDRLSGRGDQSGPSRNASVDRRLDKWGSQDFSDESPFWPAATSPKVRAEGRVAGGGLHRAVSSVCFPEDTCARAWRPANPSGGCGMQAPCLAWLASTVLPAQVFAGRQAAAGWRQVGAPHAHHCGCGHQLRGGVVTG